MTNYIQVEQSSQLNLRFLYVCQNLINQYLSNLNQQLLGKQQKVHAAIKYSLLNSGKRLRAGLVYAVADFFNIELAKLNAVAASVELIHCYSLVHDDLPAMDDDDLRRGQPSCHRAFDEATAILAGDAMQSLAFELLTDPNFSRFNSDVRSEMAKVLARAVGCNGMIFGQARDLECEGVAIDLQQLEEIHLHKTGMLIDCCIKLGILAASEDSHSCKQANWSLINQELLNYAKYLGLIFQIKDDILDVEQSSDVLGKPAKSDCKANKATFVSILGLATAKKQLEHNYQLVIDGLKNLSQYSNKSTEILKQFADFCKLRLN